MDLQEIIRHSRPLFAKMAVDYVKTNKFDEKMGFVEYMDKLAEVLGNSSARIKNNSDKFRYGQLRLILAADNVDGDSNLLIDSHFGRLREETTFKLSFPPGGKADYFARPHADYKVTNKKVPTEPEMFDLVPNDSEDEEKSDEREDEEMSGEREGGDMCSKSEKGDMSEENEGEMHGEIEEDEYMYDESEYLVKYFAVSDESDDKKKPDLVKDDEGWPWKCRSRFPDMSKDVLLYLCLMGGKQFHVFTDDKRRPMSFTCAYTSAEAAELPLLSNRNVDRPANNGLRMESLTTGAIVAASHRNGFAGIVFKAFFSSLLYELDMQRSPFIHVKFGSKVSDLLSLIVPFLAPPNRAWPDFLKDIELNLGDIARAKNNDMYDARFRDGKITVECKDYRSRPISSRDVAAILFRVKEPTVVRLVVTTKLQGQYFTRKGNPFPKVIMTFIRHWPMHTSTALESAMALRWRIKGGRCGTMISCQLKAW